MTKYNAKNERIKREYFRYQTEAKQKSKSTLRGIRKAIGRFESYTKLKDFGTFNKEQAIGFKKQLAQTKAEKSGGVLSKSTILQTVNSLKEFFQWVAFQRGYRSKIYLPDIEYLNLSEKDVRVAKTVRVARFPSLEQMSKVVETMSTESVIQRRDRALVAFVVLTGIRVSAVASLMLKHIDIHSSPPVVIQEPDLVNTKFSKQIVTHFFPVGGPFQEIITGWVTELKEDHDFSETDPLFPKTKVAHDKNDSFQVVGVSRDHWSSTTSIREIFKKAFKSASIEYFNPHRLRNTLAHLGQRVCKTPEELKAWSQSLGHDSPLTTFTSYGNIDSYRQGEILGAISKTKEPSMSKKEVVELLRSVSKEDLRDL